MKQTTTPLRLLALTAATFFLFACAVPPNGANSSSPGTIERGQESRKPKPTRAGRVITLGESPYSEDSLGPFVSWGCSEYGSDSRIIVEIGRFEAASLSDTGFILYDGTSSGERTSYERRGVNQRWDWGPNGTQFAFVLRSDGTGLFYDFSNVQKGETTLANDKYKCSRR
jgi:hypothetical protein